LISLNYAVLLQHTAQQTLVQVKCRMTVDSKLSYPEYTLSLWQPSLGSKGLH